MTRVALLVGPGLFALVVTCGLLLTGCDAGEQESVGANGACTPSCVFKACGDDGCGGVCENTCGIGQVCGNYVCLDPGDAVPGMANLPTEPMPSEGDLDGDLVQDELDNCPGLFNPAQQDMDNDYAGDPCDPDTDGDGSLNEKDCNPSDREVYPGAPERCGNLMDDNCNGMIDEEAANGCVNHFIDVDGDGAGDSSDWRCLCAPEGIHTVIVGGDCDDANPALSPLVAERCDDIDNNCNLLTDEGCDDDADGYCDWEMDVEGSPAACPQGPGDCYDYSAMVHPGAQEIASDGLDNDCDGSKEGDAAECSGPCTGPTLDASLCAMDICSAGGTVLGTSITSPSGDEIAGGWNNIQHYGDFTNDLAPYSGASYFVMGTGPVEITGNGDDLGSWGSGVADPFDATDLIYDSIEFKVTMQAPAGVTGFSIDYIFMSQEYEEWIGSSFNDKFYMILNAPQTTLGLDRVVNYTQCSDPLTYFDFEQDGQKWCYIAINTAFSEPCSAQLTNLDGTGFGALPGGLCGMGDYGGGSSTGWLTTTWPINPGEIFTLTFHIHDTADSAYDSMVLIDNFVWEGQPVQAGTGSASHN